MVHIVLHPASGKSGVVGVTEDFAGAVRCIVGEMVAGGGAHVAHYYRRNRFLHDPDSDAWIDNWCECQGTDEFYVEKWTPGSEEAEAELVMVFDGCFKQMVLDGGWSDDTVHEEWWLRLEENRCMEAYVVDRSSWDPLQSFERLRMRTVAERQAWVEAYGFNVAHDAAKHLISDCLQSLPGHGSPASETSE